MITDIWCLGVYLAGNMWNDSDTMPWCSGLLYYNELKTEKKAWREVMEFAAKNGCNAIWINPSNGVKYNSHPEIAINGAWTIEELKEEINYIKSLGMRAFPKLNFSAGHDTWLGEYSKMVSTPKYYEVCRDLIHEMCDVFETPEFMGLELDEENGLNQGRLQYACYRQYELRWHDVNYLCDCVREKGVRPNMDADYYWSFPEEFLENVPRDVSLNIWMYGNLYFDEAHPRPTDPWSSKRLDSFKDLTEAGYDIFMYGASNENTHNFEHHIRYANEFLNPDKISGMYITGSWDPINEATKDYYFDAVYQAKYAKEIYFGGK